MKRHKSLLVRPFEGWSQPAGEAASSVVGRGSLEFEERFRSSERVDATCLTFWMVIHDEGRGLSTRGESREHETWEETFLRLYQEMLPPGSPERLIVHAERRGPARGACTNTIITGYRDRNRQVQTDPPVLLRTRPPQF